MSRRTLLVFLALAGVASAPRVRPAAAQVQVRVGDSTRAIYSELHEALKAGTPQADSVTAIQRSRSPARLWRLMRSALAGTGDWNSALIGLTRLAELRNRAYADSARQLRRRLEDAPFPPFPANPGLKAEDVLPSLQAIVLERRRAVQGDSAVLADILRRIPGKDYDHGDAWVLGRLKAGAADSVAARFRAADTEEFRVRYLTLAVVFHRPEADPTAGPDIRRAGQLPGSQAIRHQGIRRIAVDWYEGESASVAGRSSGGPWSRHLCGFQSCARRLRFSGRR